MNTEWKVGKCYIDGICINGETIESMTAEESDLFEAYGGDWERGLEAIKQHRKKLGNEGER